MFMHFRRDGFRGVFYAEGYINASLHHTVSNKEDDKP
jgi:hypothetical protein